MSEVKRRELCRELLVSSDSPLLRNDDESLIFRPAQARNGTLVPLEPVISQCLGGMTVWVRARKHALTLMLLINFPEQL